MAIITIETQQKQQEQFTAIYDPSNPIALIQSTFEFIAQHSPAFFRAPNTVTGIATLIKHAATTDFPKSSDVCSKTAATPKTAATSAAALPKNRTFDLGFKTVIVHPRKSATKNSAVSPGSAAATPAASPISAAVTPAASPISVAATPAASPISAAATPAASPISATATPAASPISATATPAASPISATATPAASPISATANPAASPISATASPAASPISATATPTALPESASIAYQFSVRNDDDIISSEKEARIEENSEFRANFDPSNPMGLIQSTFEFIAQHSPDFFRLSSTVNDIPALIHCAANNDFPKTATTSPTSPKSITATPASSPKSAAATSPVSSKSEAAIASENEKSKYRAPNKANGLDLEKYTWGQTRKYVIVTVPLPPRTKHRFLSYDVKKNHIRVGVEGQPPIVYGELPHFVIPDACCYILEDKKTFTVWLRKRDKTDWWSCLVKGEPEIDIEKVVPEELTQEERWAEEKMIFDQKQIAMGLPTSDEIKKQETQDAYFAFYTKRH